MKHIFRRTTVTFRYFFFNYRSWWYFKVYFLWVSPSTRLSVALTHSWGCVWNLYRFTRRRWLLWFSNWIWRKVVPWISLLLGTVRACISLLMWLKHVIVVLRLSRFEMIFYLFMSCVSSLYLPYTTWTSSHSRRLWLFMNCVCMMRLSQVNIRIRFHFSMHSISQWPRILVIWSSWPHLHRW